MGFLANLNLFFTALARDKNSQIYKSQCPILIKFPIKVVKFPIKFNKNSTKIINTINASAILKISLIILIYLTHTRFFNLSGSTAISFPTHGAVLTRSRQCLTSAFGMRAGVSIISMTVDP